MKLSAFALIVTTVVASGSCIAAPKYPRNLFAVSSLHYDSVREAHGLDWYLKSKEAKVILGASAGLMGIDPTYVQLAVAAIPTATRIGEKTNYVLPVPSGYAYCATRIRVTSVVPAGGAQSPTINTAIFRLIRRTKGERRWDTRCCSRSTGA